MSLLLDATADRVRLAGLAKLTELVTGATISQAVNVAVELRIADLLASGARDLAELARATSSHAPSLLRLLRALASVELCTERADGSFELSPTGTLLCADAPDSLRSWILWCGRYQWPLWGSLLYSVKTGERARKLLTGTEGFGHLERDAEAAAVFNRAMVEVTRVVANEVVRVYDLAGVRRIVDVGGGYGALLAAILDAHPGIEGVLFDMPHAIEGARVKLAEVGLAERCEFVAGTFFDSVPAGGDAYPLKSVIHDWDDDRSAAILRNCRRAIAPDGKLVLVERIMPARVAASARHQAIARADLNMLVGPGGKERTEAEFRALLDASGFTTARILPTALEYSIVEGIPR